jgi:hypothetical protein
VLLHCVSCKSVLLLTMARPWCCPDMADRRICLADSLQPCLCILLALATEKARDLRVHNGEYCYMSSKLTEWLTGRGLIAQHMQSDTGSGNRIATHDEGNIHANHDTVYCISFIIFSNLPATTPHPTPPSHHPSSSATFPSHSTGSAPQGGQRTNSKDPRDQQACYTTQ